MKHDILVVGGGIAGMESSLTLAEMGYKVMLVEKESSIGGRAILLSKVFPTLDCASCITTPKMASTAHHPNITLRPFSEIKEIRRNEQGNFEVKVLRKPMFVDPAACTGCGECELACTVAVPDKFNEDLVAHRAAYIAFPQAVPKKAVIERAGTSPCSFSCPAGVKAHGYVSLIRAGKLEEAFQLHMEDAPLPGSLSRACYAPCEQECARGDVEGPVPIRALKRVMVDHYYGRHPEPEYGPLEERQGKRVAVVGSGPAGLTAAYFLGLKGYDVTVFEAAEKPGGVLRYGIPPYRLPKDLLDRDIKNITALGVEIKGGTPIRSLEALRQDGYDAVFLGVGAEEPRSLGVEGEDAAEVVDCMSFLRRANAAEGLDLSGKTVVVVGGGNAAIDPARLAFRRGAAKVIIQYRRSRAEMPAHDWEVEAALKEGVELRLLQTPKRFLVENGRLTGIETLRMKLGEPDSSGRRRPIPVEGSEHVIPADVVVLAIGLVPGTSPFGDELELVRGGTVMVNQETLETSRMGVFAGGDDVIGPSMIVKAIGHGKRAAFYIDRYLTGQTTEGVVLDDRLPKVEHRTVLARAEHAVSNRPATKLEELPVETRVHSMEEIEQTMSVEEARYSADRCLDCGVCSECHECLHACPAGAIHFDMRATEETAEVSSVILASGFKLFDAHLKSEYGYGRFPNVITAMQMDRILAPTRPYNGVLRPSDGKAPDNIAFVLCTGSRDRTMNNPLCSRICCMYSIKQAELIMGALPLADVTVYYIDIRAFGKGYEEFYQQAAGMGVQFVKGRVAKIDETETGGLRVLYEDINNFGGRKQAEHDLVVLSVGVQPNAEPFALFANEQLAPDPFGYVKEIEEEINPGKTSIAGVFAAGTASASRDIPDTVLHAGAAAAQVAAYIEQRRAGR